MQKLKRTKSQNLRLYLFFLLVVQVFFLGASGIPFENLNKEEALSKARAQKKLVFIDAYATWCMPCKQMDEVFKDEDLGSYFADHFISIKIDMDTDQGHLLHQEYDVVFLPTFIIINEEGALISKIARQLDGTSLVKFAREAVSSNSPMTKSSLAATPFTSRSGSEPFLNRDPESTKKILYVHDPRISSARPRIMFHEAYLHLELMDGKHSNVVKRYLSTQEDWLSEKNIRFIFDFLEIENSELFEFFTNNRNRFEEIIGPERVASSLYYLIQQRITQGFPRPSLEEAISLFRHIDPSTAEIKAQQYLLGKN